MVVSMVATFGTASTAANSVGYTVIDFANIPAASMGLALITVVGQCIGAGEKEQAKMYTKRCCGGLILVTGRAISHCFYGRLYSILVSSVSRGNTDYRYYIKMF